jgi:membrane associated rhomboid family serine protease
MQLFTGVMPLAAGMDQDAGGVAFWAHVGGFISGAVLAKLFDRNPQRSD